MLADEKASEVRNFKIELTSLEESLDNAQSKDSTLPGENESPEKRQPTESLKNPSSNKMKRQLTKQLLDFFDDSDDYQSDSDDFAGYENRDRKLDFVKSRTFEDVLSESADLEQARRMLKEYSDANAVDIKGMMSQLEKRRQTRAEWYIIMPDDTFKSIWDWIMLILLVWIAIFLPLQLGFPGNFGRKKYAVFIIDTIVDIFFGIDMVLTCFMALEEPDGSYCVGVRQITRRYVCHGFFAIDLLAIIPFNDLFQASKAFKVLKSVRFLRMLKALRLRNLERKLSRYDYDPRFPTGSLRLTKIFLALLCFMHFTGCLFYYIGSHTSDEESWLYKHAPGWEDESVWSRYLLSIYWSTTTLTTVGYGDYSPVNDSEIGIAMMTMIVGAIGFSLITGTVSSVFANQDESFSDFRVKMQSVYLFLRKNSQIPDDVARRIIAVLQEKWQKQILVQHQSKVNDIYRDLPRGLLKEVVFHVNSKLLAKSAFIRHLNSDYGPECVFTLFGLLRRRDIATRELVCMEREPVKYVYFIESGEYGIIDSRYPGEVLGTMGPGEHFGHVAEYMNPYHYHVWSVVCLVKGYVRVADVDAVRQNYQLSESLAQSAQVRMKRVETARTIRLQHANMREREGFKQSTVTAAVAQVDLRFFLNVAESSGSEAKGYDSEDIQEIRLRRNEDDSVEVFFSMKRNITEWSPHSAPVPHPIVLEHAAGGTTKTNMFQDVDDEELEENPFTMLDGFQPTTRGTRQDFLEGDPNEV